MSNEKRHIFLIGPSGVGKTTVAKAVGKLSDLQAVDLDDVIEHNAGMSVREIFEKHGEPAFREQEREAVRALSITSEPHVYATGGATVLDSRNIIDMRNNGYVVYLSALEPDIVERVSSDKSNHRPKLDGDLEEKVHEQFLARRECYELAADITIATSRRDVETVAEAVIRQCNRLSGQAPDVSSQIVVGTDLFPKISEYVSGYQSVVLISQDSIPSDYRKSIQESLENDGIKVVPVIVPEGEEAKTFTSFEKVISQMAEQRVTRFSCVMAIGGGVVGDLSGYVAASYHRGIDVIQVPTTLLAQVDSSIGGKCGINLSSGKNLVGAFHQPKVIIVDTGSLNTLPKRDFLSGLGEVAKYALLGNTSVADAIKDSSTELLDRNPDVLVPVIRSCMNHKLHVVARDPYERNGIRATLNLGHTLAHAIETKTNYTIAHGAAVAIGLRFVSELSCAMGRIPASQRDDSLALLDALGLQSSMPEECRNAEELVDLMYSDKKSDGGLTMILMNIGGGAEQVHDVDRETVQSVLEKFLNQ